MKCLQCGIEAKENGEMSGKIKIRECAAGHRTAPASRAMIKESEAWRKLIVIAGEDVLGLDNLSADEKERQREVNEIVKRGAQKAANI